MSTASDTRLVQEALSYAAKDWRVVPLHSITADGGCSCRAGKDCQSPGKHPRLTAWQHAASSKEEKVCAWWEQWPAANVGVAFGQGSGIIDIECDSAEAERDMILLFDGDPPIGPTFESARGKHRIFAWRPDLPPSAVSHVGAVEIRTGNGPGAQSVFPPSPHASGIDRAWLPGLDPDSIDPPAIPGGVLAKIYNLQGETHIIEPEAQGAAKPAEHWDTVLQGVAEGGRNNAAAEVVGHQLAALSDPFNETVIASTWTMIQAWNSRNRPPLDHKELKATFESILGRERRSRIDANKEAAAPEDMTRDPQTGEISTKGWRLVIVDSEPPLYKLYSTKWPGFVKLTAAEMHTPTAIVRLVLEQLQSWVDLPPFMAIWKKSQKGPSLPSQLVKAADHEAAPFEVKRNLVVADLTLAVLMSAHDSGEENEPDSRGRPTRFPDGSVVFKFSFIWGPLSMSGDKVTRIELSGILKRVGVHNHFSKMGGKRSRFSKIDADGLKTLEDLVADGGGE